MSIYVASSWRNNRHPQVVEALTEGGCVVYDFRNPAEGDHGFRWSDVGVERPCRCDHERLHSMCRAHGEPLSLNGGCECPKPETVPASDYLEGVNHPIAVDGYRKDFEAMQDADTFILVLPCGRSAHLELGWAVGRGLRTAVLLDEPCVPELMYRMVDLVTADVQDIYNWIGEEN